MECHAVYFFFFLAFFILLGHVKGCDYFFSFEPPGQSSCKIMPFSALHIKEGGLAGRLIWMRTRRGRMFFPPRDSEEHCWLGIKSSK